MTGLMMEMILTIFIYVRVLFHPRARPKVDLSLLTAEFPAYFVLCLAFDIVMLHTIHNTAHPSDHSLCK